LPELLRQLALNVLVLVVRFQFPDVETVSTQELAQRLAGPGEHPMLIDNREPREYAVSHLPGAVNLTTVQAIEAAAIPRQTPLVVYCSIGYRSAALARRLQAAGYHKVKNLEGSIFQWQKRGLPLVSGVGPVEKVHPYDEFWGALLNPEVVAYHPQNP
jgi:rhodanese-related sulfurtransferase